MKNIHNRPLAIMVFVSLLIVICFIRCDDYLSTLPDARTTLDSSKKISELLANAYPSGSYAFITETMSDNVEDKGSVADGSVGSTNSVKMNADLYAWKDITFEEELDSPFDYWSTCYKAIAHANYVLQAIEDFGESTKFNPQRGEALIARAYAHFMLVNLWGEHYDPTNASNLGVPYVREPETTALKVRKRETVVEVYKRVEEDLLAGLTLLDNNYGQPKYHFTKEAAYAFATRFYLYRGDWNQVITYANLALTNTESQIRNLRDEYGPLSFSGKITLYISDTEASNALLVNTQSAYGRLYIGARYGLSIPLASTLFLGGRGHPTGRGWAYGVFGNASINSYYLPRVTEQFVYTNRSAGIGNVYVTTVLFSYDETLLARAEAYAMKGDFGLARDDINRMVAKKTSRSTYNSKDDITDDIILKYAVNPDRNDPSDGKISVDSYSINPNYPMTDKKKAYAILIAEVRRRNHFFEGLRWFDIKRFHIPITHKYEEGSSAILGQNDLRRVLQIPKRAQLVAGLKPNPR